ncbi:MAG: ATP-binding protein, partial [Myxococcota bacterium]
MIGRHAERELLDRCLRALEVSGQGATIYVEGESGIGKSRLVACLLEQARATSVRALVGHADAIEQTTHYHVWRPVLAELLGREAARDAATLRERLAAMLDADSLARAPLLGSLLPIPMPETPQTLRMEPQGRAEAARELLVAILERAVQRAPLLLVLEDAHWMDSGSWEIARLARERLPRLLLVVCARPMGPGLPEEAQRLRAAAGVQRVVLDVLEPDEALALVCERLDVDSLPEALARFIQQRAEGHPFFTEELTHSLRDHGLIAVEAGECTLVGSAAQLERLDLPETVQGVVTTRIDHLDPRQELTLKVASVLGRRFSVSDVSSVHPLEAEWEVVAGQLTAVAELGLVVAEPGDQYRFKHAIVQETAYRLLPFAQRCELHRRMAELLERTRAADLASSYPLLAHHWREAGDVDKQRNYLGLAGERALLRDYANTEAAQFLGELLALGDPQAAQGELGARVAIALPDGRRLAPQAVERARRERLLGEALMNLGRHAEGWPHMERALNGFGEALPRTRFSLVSSVVLELAALLLRKPSALPHRTPPEPARAVLAEIVRTWERIGIAGYSRGVSQQGITSTSQGVFALGILALLRAVKAAWAMG